MADTFFIDQVTVIEADWLNDLNRLNYTVFNNPATFDDLGLGNLIVLQSLTGSFTITTPQFLSGVSGFGSNSTLSELGFSSSDLAVANGVFYAQGQNGDVEAYDTSFTNLPDLAWSANAQTGTAAFGLAFDGEYFYVGDRGTPSFIHKYNVHGSFTGVSFVADSTNLIGSLSFSDDTLWVLLTNGTVKRFSRLGEQIGSDIDISGTVTSANAIMADSDFFWVAGQSPAPGTASQFDHSGVFQNREIVFAPATGPVSGTASLMEMNGTQFVIGNTSRVVWETTETFANSTTINGIQMTNIGVMANEGDQLQMPDNTIVTVNRVINDNEVELTSTTAVPSGTGTITLIPKEGEREIVSRSGGVHRWRPTKV